MSTTHWYPATRLQAAPESPPGADILTSSAQIAQMATCWQRLVADGGPVEGHAWAQACARTLAAPGTVRIVCVRRDGEPVAIAALQEQRAFGLRTWGQLGVDMLYEPMDLPCRDAEAADLLLDALLEAGCPVLLQRMPADAPLLIALARRSPQRVPRIVRPAPPAPFITLDADWRQPEPPLNPRRRADLRRARRRAQALGEVCCDILAPAPDQTSALLDIAFDVEARSWKGEAGTALMHDHARQAFFRAWAEVAASDGTLRIAFLRIGDVIAAMQIAAVAGGAWWLLKIGYDRALAACSPGQLLLADTLSWAAHSGLARYEMLGLPATWIDAWTRSQHECVSLRIFPRTLQATLLRSATVLAARLRRTP